MKHLSLFPNFWTQETRIFERKVVMESVSEFPTGESQRDELQSFADPQHDETKGGTSLDQFDKDNDIFERPDELLQRLADDALAKYEEYLRLDDGKLDPNERQLLEGKFAAMRSALDTLYATFQNRLYQTDINYEQEALELQTAFEQALKEYFSEVEAWIAEQVQNYTNTQQQIENLKTNYETLIETLEAITGRKRGFWERIFTKRGLTPKDLEKTGSIHSVYQKKATGSAWREALLQMENFEKKGSQVQENMRLLLKTFDEDFPHQVRRALAGNEPAIQRAQELFWADWNNGTSKQQYAQYLLDEYARNPKQFRVDSHQKRAGFQALDQELMSVFLVDKIVHYKTFAVVEGTTDPTKIEPAEKKRVAKEQSSREVRFNAAGRAQVSHLIEKEGLPEYLRNLPGINFGAMGISQREFMSWAATVLDMQPHNVRTIDILENLDQLNGDLFEISETERQGAMKFLQGKTKQSLAVIGGAEYALENPPSALVDALAVRFNIAANGEVYQLGEKIPASAADISAFLENMGVLRDGKLMSIDARGNPSKKLSADITRVLEKKVAEMATTRNDLQEVAIMIQDSGMDSATDTPLNIVRFVSGILTGNLASARESLQGVDLENISEKFTEIISPYPDRFSFSATQLTPEEVQLLTKNENLRNQLAYMLLRKSGRVTAGVDVSVDVQEISKVTILDIALSAKSSDRPVRERESSETAFDLQESAEDYIANNLENPQTVREIIDVVNNYGADSSVGAEAVSLFGMQMPANAVREMRDYCQQTLVEEFLTNREKWSLLPPGTMFRLDRPYLEDAGAYWIGWALGLLDSHEGLRASELSAVKFSSVSTLNFTFQNGDVFGMAPIPVSQAALQSAIDNRFEGPPIQPLEDSDTARAFFYNQEAIAVGTVKAAEKLQ